MYANLSTKLQDACLANLARVALYDVDGSAISFEQLLSAIRSSSAHLKKGGVAPRKLVALNVRHPTVRAILRFAVVRLGADLIEAEENYARDTLGLALDIVVADKFSGHFDPKSQIRFDDSWFVPTATAPDINGHGRFLRTTSGTTGTPKLRLITEQNLLARIKWTNTCRGAPSGPAFIGYNPSASPTVNRMLGALLVGQASIQPQCSTKDSLEAMDRFECTDAYLSPYNFNELLDAARTAQIRPRALNRILVGGGAVSPARAEMAEALFGCPVFATYGSNETGSIAYGRITAFQDIPGCVGYVPDTTEIRIDPIENDQEKDGRGTIHIKVPPEKSVLSYPNNQSMGDAEGWVNTGDIGQIMPDRRLILKGRLTEHLNVGGNKKAPSFFEDIAFGFDGIDHLVAFGVPEHSGSERVGLAIKARNSFSLDAFANFMARALGPRYPMQIAVVTKIPVNQGGKVDRVKLRQIFSAAQDSIEDNQEG